MGLKWETIEHDHGNHLTRAKVFGGWLVMSTDDVMTSMYDGYGSSNSEGYEWRTSLTFVPDLKYEWKL